MQLKQIPLVFLLCVSATIGMAQTQDIDTIQGVYLNEVVIGVNKTPEIKKNVAQQIEVLNATEIKAAQAPTTADLLMNTGNLFVQKSQAGGGSPVLRGFEANRILLVVDGVRMNNIIYRGGHLQNVITIDNAILERVEVLFGSSSSVYGSDALGGVIHFYTKKPQFASNADSLLMKVNASTRYGSVNRETSSHLDFNIGGNKWASLSSITYTKFGDLKSGRQQNPFYDGSYTLRPYYAAYINGKDSIVKNQNPHIQVGSGYQQYDILQKIAFRQNNYTTHNLNLQFSNSGDVPRYDRLTDPKGSSVSLNYAEWYYGPQTRGLAAYNFNQNKPNSYFSSLHLGANYQYIAESRHTRKFGSDWRTNRLENVAIGGFNLDLKRVVRMHSLRFGADMQYNNLRSTAFSRHISNGAETSLDTRYPDGKNQLFNIALYASHTWQFLPKTLLTDAIRLGYIDLKSQFVDTTFYLFPFKEAHQQHFVYSGSLGLVHTPSNDLKLSALLSTGFRAPNVDDLSKVFESTQRAVIIPNNQLKPEQTINTEIGITKIFNQLSSWETNIYYTQLMNAIVTDKFQFNGSDSILYDGAMSQVWANQNKRQAYTYGFSSVYKGRFSPCFGYSLGVNYTFGRIKTDSLDTPLDHIPPLIARLQCWYNYKQLSATLLVLYNGAKRLKDYSVNGEDNLQYATSDGTPAWLVANLRVGYKLHRLISIQAGVDNLLDTQYRTFASGINGAGRNIFFSLQFHY